MSHINRDQAPDPFLLECNRIADFLATEACSYFPSEVILTRKPLLLPGVCIGCRIRGRLENNDLYNTIKLSVDRSALTEYFSSKYGWSQSTLDNIARNANFQEINKYPKPAQATLVKYLHGWLATKTMLQDKELY